MGKDGQLNNMYCFSDLYKIQYVGALHLWFICLTNFYK